MKMIIGCVGLCAVNESRISISYSGLMNPLTLWKLKRVLDISLGAIVLLLRFSLVSFSIISFWQV